MANFYLQPVGSPETFYELHATTAVSVSFSSSVTNYPTESGAAVSDNVVMNPDQVSFEGVLTDVKQSGFSPSQFIGNLLTGNAERDQPKSWSEYIEDLRILQFSKEVFKVYYSGDNDGELSNIEFAILTRFDINKDTSLGNSWSVGVTLQEVRYADRPEIVAEPRTTFSARLAANQEGSGNTASLDSPQESQVERRLFTAGIDRGESATGEPIFIFN